MKTYTITGDSAEVSDGFHTMSELYDHRRALTAALFSAWRSLGVPVMKAKEHSDGTMFDGYFIVMAIRPTGQISYHYDREYWDQFDVPEVPRTPPWDGHSAADVIHRLLANADLKDHPADGAKAWRSTRVKV
jgi:hypothetical protein